MGPILPKQRKRRELRRFHGKGLATQAESCEHLLISLRIGAGKIIEEFAAAGDETQETATRRDVFFVGREVLGKVADALGHQCDLHVGAAGVTIMKLKLRCFVA